MKSALISRLSRASMLLVMLAMPVVAARIAGRVHAPDGHGLTQVAVRLTAMQAQPATQWQVTTRVDGSFVVVVPDGEYTVTISAADYGVFQRNVTVPPDAEIDAQLEPGLGASYRSVTVVAKPIEPAGDERSIDRGEIENLKNTLADDPLRSVQVMPGVTATDDFRDNFSYRGAPFSDIAMVIDGMRPAGVVHTVENIDSGSISFVNSDALDSAVLRSVDITQPSAGGTLTLSTRPADSESFHGSASAGTASAAFSGGGPLPFTSSEARRPALLLGARQSYLASLIRHVRPDSDVLFDYRDLFGRLDVPISSRQQFVLETMDGSDVGQRGTAANAEPYQLKAEGVLAFSEARWLAQFGGAAVSLAAAQSRNTFDNNTSADNVQESDRISEAQVRADAQWTLAATNFAAGLDRSRLSVRQSQVFFFPDNQLAGMSFLDDFTQQNLFAYIQEAAPIRQFWLTTGVNFQHSNQFSENPFGARVSLGWRGNKYSADVLLAREIEYPLSSEATLLANDPAFLPALMMKFERPLAPADALTSQAGVGRRFGRMSLEISVFRRRVTHEYLPPDALPWRIPSGIPVLPAGTAAGPIFEYPRNGGLAADGYELSARGRLAANLQGWVAYTHSRARTFDPSRYSNTWYPSDFDVPDAFTAYLSYHPRPLWNLTGIVRAMSNVPISGFYTGEAPDLVITSSGRNQLRLPAYQRTDLRLERDFFIHRWRLAAFGEALNVTAHHNQRYFTSELQFNPTAGVVTQPPEDLLPRIIGAGLRLDF